jgi:hypothetical protein
MAKVHGEYVPHSMSDYDIGIKQGYSEDLDFAVKHGDAKRIPNYAEQTPFPKGAVKDRANDANRRPTVGEERDEHQSKLLSKYGQDALDSHAEHQARHEAELAKLEGN